MLTFDQKPTIIGMMLVHYYLFNDYKLCVENGNSFYSSLVNLTPLPALTISHIISMFHIDNLISVKNSKLNCKTIKLYLNTLMKCDCRLPSFETKQIEIYNEMKPTRGNSKLENIFFIC